MSQSANQVTHNHDFDREVKDLFSFLQEFESPGWLKTRDQHSTSNRQPPLSTLEPNCLGLDVSDQDENDSLSMIYSKVQEFRGKGSWVVRMSQALQNWKYQHKERTEQELAAQQTRLLAQHNKELQQVREELHEHFKKAFRSWQEEFLSTLQPLRDGPLVPADRSKSMATTTHQTPVAAVSGKNISNSRRRKQWKSPEGIKIITYTDGTRREQQPDGTTVTRFANGDIQTTGSSSDWQTKSCYLYGSSKIMRFDQIDGSTRWCFPNGQWEHHFPDGRIVVEQWGEDGAC